MKLSFFLVVKDFSNTSKIHVTTGRISGLTIETILPGGFGACSFDIALSEQESVVWYYDYFGKPIIIYDFYGIVIYEGRIEGIEFSSDGISVTAVGHYAFAGDLLHGMIYPTTVAKTISDVIRDSISLVSYWNAPTNANIVSTTGDITPQDFTGEKKVKDAIESVLKYGLGGTNPRRVHFALWENRTAYLFSEPYIGVDIPKWCITSANFSGSSGFTMSTSKEGMYNKIQVFYDEAGVGKTFTNWYENKLNQSKYGTRVGSIDIGASKSTIAAIVGELAIKYQSIPQQTSSLQLNGFINTYRGTEYPLYMLRAGDMFSIMDVDALYRNANANPIAVGVATRTSYTADSNTLSIEVGSRNNYMDILLTRLGVSSGSIS